MNGFEAIGVVYSLIAVILISGCTVSDECYVTVESSFGSGSSRYRICSWSQINNWLVSDADRLRRDGVNGYECFVDKPREWDSCVSFALGFGGEAQITADGLTLYCENFNQDILLPVSGFPQYCKGIYLKGHFDMSKVRIGKGVENVYMGDILYDGFDCEKGIPNFDDADNLRYLEVVMLSGAYADVDRIPVLDAVKFSCLDQLTNCVVDVGFLISHVEKLSECKSLQKIDLHSSFTISGNDSDDGENDIEERSGIAVECCIDDSSFVELINRDFRDVERLVVEINLKKTRTWDISALAKKRLKLISIKAKNCWVIGMESFRQSKGLTWFGVKMEIEVEAPEDYNH